MNRRRVQALFTTLSTLYAELAKELGDESDGEEYGGPPRSTRTPAKRAGRNRPAKPHAVEASDIEVEKARQLARKTGIPVR